MSESFQLEIQDPAITQKGVEAIIDFYETLAVDKLNFPGLHVVMTGANSPYLNVVIDTRKNEPLTSEVLESIVHFFKRHQVEWIWFSTPLAQMNDLETHQFKLVETFPSLYWDLSQPLPPVDEKITIKVVDEYNDLKQWIEPLADAFPSEDNGEYYRKLNAALLNKGNKKLMHFIAFHNNEPAAAATLFLSGDSVMLHNLGTKQAFRNRGLGQALALYRMHLAKSLGFKHCFLDASEDGYKLHKKLGLKVYAVTGAYQL